MYRRRRYKRRGRRSYSKKRKIYKRTILAASRTRMAKPEIKHLEVQYVGTTLATSWKVAVLSPTQITRGVNVTQMIGQKIKGRWMIINMAWTGAQAGDVNKAAPDGIVRIVIYTPIQDTTSVTNYITSLPNNVNQFLDYDVIRVIRDFKVVLGNTTDQSGATFTRSFVIKVPWPHDIRTIQVGSTDTFNFDTQRDVLYMAHTGYGNDAHFDITTRFTYTDS